MLKDILLILHYIALVPRKPRHTEERKREHKQEHTSGGQSCVCGLRRALQWGTRRTRRPGPNRHSHLHRKASVAGLQDAVARTKQIIRASGESATPENLPQRVSGWVPVCVITCPTLPGCDSLHKKKPLCTQGGFLESARQ